MKSFFASKTNWLMIFLTLIGALTEVAGFMSANPHPDASGIIMVIVGILGIVVRTWFTNTAINAPVLTSISNMVALTQAAKQAPVTSGPAYPASAAHIPPVINFSNPSMTIPIDTSTPSVPVVTATPLDTPTPPQQ